MTFPIKKHYSKGALLPKKVPSSRQETRPAEPWESPLFLDYFTDDLRLRLHAEISLNRAASEAAILRLVVGDDGVRAATLGIMVRTALPPLSGTEAPPFSEVVTLPTVSVTASPPREYAGCIGRIGHSDRHGDAESTLDRIGRNPHRGAGRNLT